MKKLIRILFLLLLIQFVATACTDKEGCTGEPAEGFFCKQDGETGDCDEIETCSSKKNESPTNLYCNSLIVYDFTDKKELTDSICVLNSDGNACEGKPKCPTTIESGDDCT